MGKNDNLCTFLQNGSILKFNLGNFQLLNPDERLFFYIFMTFYEQFLYSQFALKIHFCDLPGFSKFTTDLQESDLVFYCFLYDAFCLFADIFFASIFSSSTKISFSTFVISSDVSIHCVFSEFLSLIKY